ncbi:CLUMA_CG018734, isoform A [Clunio marinus]|uniref:Tetraspanin n=1 Tax=Clunio marinus TaxID=568069 RepID=A0A1J1J2M9_9DIPT|nr:CLUMA_CG018734, isoform A [Clunio marinus]
MGLNCGASLIKYVLFVFNLICAIGGIALMAVGGIALKKIDEVKDVFNDGDHPGFFPAAIIALGALIFIIAFFGCCGAIRESQCLLNLYALCLLIVIVLQVLLSIYVIVYNRDVQETAMKGWDRIWGGRSVAEINRRTIDKVQETIHCCGSQYPLDWGLAIPRSCCDPNSQVCNELYSYRIGCKQQIRNITENYSAWIAYLSLVMAVIELVGVIFGCCLSSNIRNSSRYD